MASCGMTACPMPARTIACTAELSFERNTYFGSTPLSSSPWSMTAWQVQACCPMSGAPASRRTGIGPATTPSAAGDSTTNSSSKSGTSSTRGESVVPIVNVRSSSPAARSASNASLSSFSTTRSSTPGSSARSRPSTTGSTLTETLWKLPTTSRPALPASTAASSSGRRLDLAQDHVGVLHEHPPERRQLDRSGATGSIEHGRPERAFERGDLLADRRLREAEPGGSAAERSRFGDGLHGGEMTEIGTGEQIHDISLADHLDRRSSLFKMARSPYVRHRRNDPDEHDHVEHTRLGDRPGRHHRPRRRSGVGLANGWAHRERRARAHRPRPLAARDRTGARLREAARQRARSGSEPHSGATGRSIRRAPDTPP